MLLMSTYNVGDVVYVFREKPQEAKEYNPNDPINIVLQVAKVKIYNVEVSRSETGGCERYLGSLLNENDNTEATISFYPSEATKNPVHLKASNIFGKELKVKIVLEYIYKMFEK